MLVAVELQAEEFSSCVPMENDSIQRWLQFTVTCDSAKSDQEEEKEEEQSSKSGPLNGSLSEMGRSCFQLTIIYMYSSLALSPPLILASGWGCIQWFFRKIQVKQYFLHVKILIYTYVLPCDFTRMLQMETGPLSENSAESHPPATHVSSDPSLPPMVS